MRQHFSRFAILISLFYFSCSSTPVTPDVIETKKFPNIDLSHWKVTIPIGNPTEVEPPQILNYATNPVLNKFMFNDTDEGALVFYTIQGSTTANSSYPRTELREQMTPGSNNDNWTFAEGGKMKGTLRVSRVSGEENNLDRIIVMQIHGRLTDEQRELIGEDDNNAPPVLKIYWDDGKINVRRKVLKDLDVSDLDILKTDAWKDESVWFDLSVMNNSFTLEIEVEEGSIKVSLLNTDEVFIFNDIHMEKWGIFENYFKAGNYLNSNDDDSFSEVRYYKLEVKH